MRKSIAVTLLCLTPLAAQASGMSSGTAPKGMVRIEAGTFEPLYAGDGAKQVAVRAFAIDREPMKQTGLSWFEASAACKARGARLPTTNEWEYVARASETERDASKKPAFRQRTLQFAMRANPGFRNVWGVTMHTGINEWTQDWQHVFGHNHAGEHSNGMSCAAGAVTNGDSGDYAAFLRYAFRATAREQTKQANVGFRCAASL